MADAKRKNQKRGAMRADELLYDESLTLADKRSRLTEMADKGDTLARGYLESIARIEHLERAESDAHVRGGGEAVSREGLDALRQVGEEIERRKREEKS
jgi:hypothetical protein